MVFQDDKDSPWCGEGDADDQFNAEASRPGGAAPVLMRCRRTRRTCGGSVLTASTFIGEPQRLHFRGLPRGCAPLPPVTSTSWIFASSRAQGCAGLPGRDGLGRGILVDLAAVESAALLMLPNQSLGCEAHEVGSRLAPMLQELDEELHGGEQLHVRLEVPIVLRAVQDACFVFFHGHLAEGDRTSNYSPSPAYAPYVSVTSSQLMESP